MMPELLRRLALIAALAMALTPLLGGCGIECRSESKLERVVDKIGDKAERVVDKIKD